MSKVKKIVNLVVISWMPRCIVLLMHMFLSIFVYDFLIVMKKWDYSILHIFELSDSITSMFSHSEWSVIIWASELVLIGYSFVYILFPKQTLSRALLWEISGISIFFIYFIYLWAYRLGTWFWCL